MQNDILYTDIDSKIFDLSELSYQIDTSINHWEPNCSYFLSSSELGRGLSKKDINNKISYIMNNTGHRCDDIKNLDIAQHNILFAGCSTTFGDGLPYETTWDHLLYDEIKKDHKNIGPFHSLGYPGGSASKIIMNVFKYCNNFGNPNEIFILLPDYARTIKYDSQNREISPDLFLNYLENKIIGNSNLEEMFFEFQNYCRILETYCKSNNISLYISSWDEATTEVAKKINLKTFYSLDFEKRKEYIDTFDIQHDSLQKNKEYLLNARDKNHFGIIFHQWFKDSFHRWRKIDD